MVLIWWLFYAFGYDTEIDDGVQIDITNFTLLIEMTIIKNQHGRDNKIYLEITKLLGICGLTVQDHPPCCLMLKGCRFSGKVLLLRADCKRLNGKICQYFC